MKYKLGEFVFTKDNSSNEYFESQPIGNRKACFDEWMLIKLGATPIDDKPEKIEKHKPMPNWAEYNENVWWHIQTIDEKLNQVIDWINNHERKQ